MKVLKISGGDFAVLHFQEEYSGVAVSSIIDNVEDYSVENSDNEDAEWELSVFELGEVSEEFVKFIREDIQEYNSSKDVGFYLETEIV